MTDKAVKEKTRWQKIVDGANLLASSIMMPIIFVGLVIGGVSLFIFVFWMFFSAIYCSGTVGWGITTILECQLNHTYADAVYWVQGEK